MNKPLKQDSVIHIWDLTVIITVNWSEVWCWLYTSGIKTTVSLMFYYTFSTTAPGSVQKRFFLVLRPVWEQHEDNHGLSTTKSQSWIKSGSWFTQKDRVKSSYKDLCSWNSFFSDIWRLRNFWQMNWNKHSSKWEADSLTLILGRGLFWFLTGNILNQFQG